MQTTTMNPKMGHTTIVCPQCKKTSWLEPVDGPDDPLVECCGCKHLMDVKSKPVVREHDLAYDWRFRIVVLEPDGEKEA